MPREITAEEALAHDRLYEAGWRLLKPQMLLEGKAHRRKPGFLGAFRLRKAIRLFAAALNINPQGWQSMWAIGKAYQRLDDNSSALDHFKRASALAPDHPDVLREAAVSAIAIRDPAAAVRFAKAALQLRPADTGLISNLSVAYLVAGDAAAARELLERSLASTPNDPALRTTLQFLGDVVAGRQQLPTGRPRRP
jgi:Flp pilus assembly protein TadD